MLRTAALAFLLLAAQASWCCRAHAESSDLTDDEKARIEADRDLRRKLSEAARKVEDQQKKWESERRDEETASSDEERKTANKARKKKEKEADEARSKEESSRKEETASSEKRGREGEGKPARSGNDDGRYRVNYAGHSVPASRSDEGGWMELGGVTRGARYGASNSGGSVREGGTSGTSIGVRATVIRLGDPDE